MADRFQILITGAAGYIGSHTVVELFKAGFEPILIDNFINSEPKVIENLKQITGKEISFYEGDCNDKEFLNIIFKRHKNIKGVIHFAAHKSVGESVTEPIKYYENNIGSLLVLLKEMKENKVSNIVFSSSCTVYGQPDQLPVTEKTPQKTAESPYGKTKQMCEAILEDVVNSKAKIKAIALRYFNPVGAHPSALIGELPRGVPNNLVPYVTQTAAGIREKLTIFGNDYNTSDGTCLRDFIHVVDLAKAHVKAFDYLEKQQEESFYDIFNVGTGGGNTVLEVVKTFEKISGKKLNYSIGDRREGDIEKIYANVDKAQTLLGWKAEHSFEEALTDSWRWQETLKK
ncbi:MAG: UDP-glucose 4-epimerase GalE [Bacteroidota bacterium]|nr:UDP-glucose 4-epimerase GalE [Bacteroidota bacterium]